RTCSLATHRGRGYSIRRSHLIRSSRFTTMLLVAAAALALYAQRLDVSPPSLHPDEIDLGRQAEAIAREGRDTDGRRFPLFFRLHDNVWLPPLPVYVTALALSARPSSMRLMRLPAALVAAIDVALMS